MNKNFTHQINCMFQDVVDKNTELINKAKTELENFILFAIKESKYSIEIFAGMLRFNLDLKINSLTYKEIYECFEKSSFEFYWEFLELLKKRLKLSDLYHKTLKIKLDEEKGENDEKIEVLRILIIKPLKKFE